MDQQAVERAIRSAWTIRESQAAKQLQSGRTDAGKRGAVTGGAHLDAIAELLRDVFVEAGFPDKAVRHKSGIELPGYYRATKKWDLVVVHERKLVAAIELKSQFGPSFGNNFNNRTEEALGSAVDVRQAYLAGAFGLVQPWLGYVLLLEEAPGSTRKGTPRSGSFPIDPIFENTSYKDRYAIFCRRLVQERLYDAACFVTSSGAETPIDQPDPELDFAHFLAAIAGRVAYFTALGG